MDARVRNRAVPASEPRRSRRALPPEAPIAMAQQKLHDVRRRPLRERDGQWRVLVILCAALGLTAFASMEMYDVLDAAGVSVLEWLALGLFSLNFAWISAAAATAVAGALLLLFSGRRKPSAHAFNSESRTAIVFPIYNEDPASVMGAAAAVQEELEEAGADRAFEIFFLSDTNDPDRALAEEVAFEALRREMPNRAFYYRRRTINRVRKSGNIEDFVQRWGGRYDYMVIFDADSLMTAGALCELVRRMDVKPRTALIQTLPTIIKARTTFARAQQFAMRAYGPIFGAGLAWWSGGAGNYWGHNAIIRVNAFAAHAGLPDLPGKAPLGGPILSHDFVEAALLRRAGWRVEIAPDIVGSHEQCPPSLNDVMVRDGRWIQGNLQHLGVVGARGLDGLSRLHIASGIMGYAASPMWAALLVVGSLLSVFATGATPDYFSGNGPYPSWPVADTNHAVGLFVLTAVVVLSPKWLSALLWLFGRLPGWSHDPRFIGGLVVETLLSVAIAPIQMVSQTLAVIRTLTGRDGGWAPQTRDRDRLELGDALRQFAPHLVVAVLLAAPALWAGVGHLAWTAPIILPLILAAPISVLTARRVAEGGLAFQAMRIPEERVVPPVQVRAERAADIIRHDPTGSFEEAVLSPDRSRKRAVFVDHNWPLGENDVHAPTGSVLARLEHAALSNRPIGELSRAERMAVLNNPRLARRLRRVAAERGEKIA